MIATQDYRQWLPSIALVVLYVVMCIRIARRVARTGRNETKWFFITMFLTSIPAGIILYRHYTNSKFTKTHPIDSCAEPEAQLDIKDEQPDHVTRCRHCGWMISTDELKDDHADICPGCGMSLNEEYLA